QAPLASRAHQEGPVAQEHQAENDFLSGRPDLARVAVRRDGEDLPLHADRDPLLGRAPLRLILGGGLRRRRRLAAVGGIGLPRRALGGWPRRAPSRFAL